jgi:hypothetical protein
VVFAGHPELIGVKSTGLPTFCGGDVAAVRVKRPRLIASVHGADEPNCDINGLSFLRRTGCAW